MVDFGPLRASYGILAISSQHDLKSSCSWLAGWLVFWLNFHLGDGFFSCWCCSKSLRIRPDFEDRNLKAAYYLVFHKQRPSVCIMHATMDTIIVNPPSGIRLRMVPNWFTIMMVAQVHAYCSSRTYDHGGSALIDTAKISINDSVLFTRNSDVPWRY